MTPNELKSYIYDLKKFKDTDWSIEADYICDCLDAIEKRGSADVQVKYMDWSARYRRDMAQLRKDYQAQFEKLKAELTEPQKEDQE